MFNIPALVSFAVTILLTFLKSTVKNLDSTKAKALAFALTTLRDAINDFLTVFDQKFTPEGRFKE
jgi:hypothetical protein